ncbi:MAG: translation elongation factor 4, partial [Firmicutes bacterium]|nr:translation elongation factor 4 [Bacillota bacterium]
MNIAACEGAVLIVDATQGVEAQTLANVYLALDEDLEIVPVINKIDLASARPDEAKQEIEDVIGLDASDAPLISAKEGINIDGVLEAIVEKVPAPSGDPDAPLKALIFDSYYDNYKGVVIYTRVFDGSLKAGDKIKMMNTGAVYDVTEVGVNAPYQTPVAELSAGSVGYVCASIKQVRDARVGDTITLADRPAKEHLPGYKKVQPMVYCGIYPTPDEKYENVKDCLEKLQVNDAAFVFEPETSQALGYGFRCGFLGLLHMEIIVERLEREFDLEIITTSPSVIYKVVMHDGSEVMIENPSNLPNPTEYDHIEEPMVKATIMLPKEYVGSIMALCQDRRGNMTHMEYITEDRVALHYDMPLNEVIYDFFDALKSKTRGYGSLDYEFDRYERSQLVKLDILLNKEPVDAFSMIVHESKAYGRARFVCEKLKEVIPMHQFEVPIQAAIGQKVIARETVNSSRFNNQPKEKDALLYGGGESDAVDPNEMWLQGDR